MTAVKPSSLMLPTVGTLCDSLMQVRSVSRSRSVTYTVVSEQAVCRALEAGRRCVVDCNSEVTP